MSLYQPVIDEIVSRLERVTAQGYTLPEAIATDQSCSALSTVIKQNNDLIRRQIAEIHQYILLKIPFIEELERVNELLEQQIGQIKKEGARPTVPTAKRAPKAG